jgi:uncharacterized coiled-coil protein SlyX
MATVQDRLSSLETKVDKYSQAIGELRGLIVALDRRFDAVDRRFEAVDHRLQLIDQRFQAIDQRFDAVDRRFNWVIGIQFSILISVIAALVGIIGTGLPR